MTVYGYGLLVLWGLPLVYTFKAIHSRSNNNELTRWLHYWSVVVLITIIDQAIGSILWRNTAYIFVKLGFFIWAMNSRTQGATLVYNKSIRVFMERYEPHIDQVLDKFLASFVNFIVMFFPVQAPTERIVECPPVVLKSDIKDKLKAVCEIKVASVATNKPVWVSLVAWWPVLDLNQGFNFVAPIIKLPISKESPMIISDNTSCIDEEVEEEDSQVSFDFYDDSLDSAVDNNNLFRKIPWKLW